MDNLTQESLLPLNKSTYTCDEFKLILTQFHLKIKALITEASEIKSIDSLWYTKTSLCMEHFVFKYEENFKLGETIYTLLSSHSSLNPVSSLSEKHRIPLLIRSKFLWWYMSYNTIFHNDTSRTFSYRDVVSLIIDGMTDKWNSFGGFWLLQNHLEGLNVEWREHQDVKSKNDLYNYWMKKLLEMGYS
jgi:hypothetical protein